MTHIPRRFQPLPGRAVLRTLLTAATTALLVAAPCLLACSTSGGGKVLDREPAAPDAVAADPHVRDALERSCYDCHSDRGAPTWYAKLAFSYWFSGRARNTLDFSAWPEYDEARRATELAAIAKTVGDGSMPPWDYTLMLSSAKLTPEDKQAVEAWATGQAPAPAAQ
jgi:hypothetical protein